MKVKKQVRKNSNFKDMLINYYSFYKINLKKKHIIIYALTLIIFTILSITFINNIDDTKTLLSQIEAAKGTTSILGTIFKEKIPLIFLLVFSGITPFIYVPVVGIIGYPYILAINLVDMSAFNIILAIFGGIIQLFGATLAISAGIYYCNCSTKKFRYDQSVTFGLDDVKLQIYESTKKDEKVNKLKEKMLVKKEKREKLNVKIEYKALVITTVISSVIVIISALITGV